MMLIAGGIIVPNLALATFAIWYGVPPRSASIAIYALIGLTLSRGRWTSVIPLVIAASLCILLRRYRTGVKRLIISKYW